MTETWNEQATRAIVSLAATNMQFTVDDAWQWLNLAGTGQEPEDPKALGGIMHNTSQRLGVISPLPSWCTSVRKTDRPIRMWVGTGRAHPTVKPTENDVVAALTAIEMVGRARSQLLMDAVRVAQRKADTPEAVSA